MSDIDERRAAELRREYLKRWRANNPDRVKQYNRNYWIRKAQKSREEKSGGDAIAENEANGKVLSKAAPD